VFRIAMFLRGIAGCMDSAGVPERCHHGMTIGLADAGFDIGLKQLPLSR
jgi:hypothetical protein